MENADRVRNKDNRSSNKGRKRQRRKQRGNIKGKYNRKYKEHARTFANQNTPYIMDNKVVVIRMSPIEARQL